MFENLLIDDIFFTITLSILFLFATFLIAKGPLTDKRYKKWRKKINERGWVVISIHFLIIIIYLLQSINTSNWIELKNEKLKHEQDERAEKIKKEVVKETDLIYLSLAKAFDKQGIKIDSLKQVIANKKSTNFITNNKTVSAEPFIHLLDEEIRLENNGVYFGLYNVDAGATNFNSEFKILINWKNGKEELIKVPFLNEEYVIPANFSKGGLPLIEFKNSNIGIADISFHLIGAYTNRENTSVFKLDYLYSYDNKEKKFKNQHGKSKDSVLRLIKNYNRRQFN